MRRVKEELYKKESGDIMVEATIIFPIMFIIIFILIYMGNAYYIKAKIEAVVVEEAINGANQCTDPLLQSVKETGTIPSLGEMKIKPYRYLFGGMDNIETEIGERVESRITGSGSSFFKNMHPSLVTNTKDIAKFNNYVVYSTFSVEVEYEVRFPIRMLFTKDNPIMRITARADIPVNDTSEFIRNSDMVIDLFYGTKVGQTISAVFTKVNDFISQFASK